MAIFNWQFSRRNFLAGGSVLSAWAGLAPQRLLASLGGLAGKAAAPANIYERLGVRTRINAKGTYTYLTGSLLPPQVARSMEEAAQHYVVLDELQRAVGERIARLLGVEAACVTSGAAGAMVIGTAACITGKDLEKIKRIPDTAGMKNEVVIQKAHRYAFDHAIRNVGVRLVEVETEDDLERAINDKTAMLHFLNEAQNRGKIGLQKWVEAGQRHGIPTFNDAAADVPPVSHLSDYNKMGFDLVSFSGGKGLCGPQCAGLLLGRKDLIEAALLNNNPSEDTIGRPLKVGKEEIVGMYVALQLYLKADHEAEWKDWEARLDVIDRMASSVPGVHTGRFVPEVANHVPHLYLQWDEKALGITPAECLRQLEDGNPSIACLGGQDYKYGLAVTPFMMKPGEEKIVGRRLKELLSAAQKRHAA
jgi:D-glucosaminate-6-phosphate ammonia-lyase